MAEAARVVTTDAEIDQALARARQFAKYDRRVSRADYSRTTKRLRLLLDDGARYELPVRLIQGLAHASDRELSRIQIIGRGTGLLWPVIDMAHYVPALLEGVYGTEKWMAALRRQGKMPKLARLGRPPTRKPVS